MLDDSTFTYQDVTEPGKIISGKRSVTSDGYGKNIGYTFTLTHGEYMEDRNLLAVSVVRNQGTENETTILCDVVNGSLIEDDFNRFTIVNKNIQSGDQIIARYFRIVRIGNPYPRIFLTDRKPDTLPSGIQKSEHGDIWIDFAQTVDQTSNAWLAERSDMLGWNNFFTEDENGYKQMPNLRVEWGNIDHKPLSIKDLGMEEEVRRLIRDAIMNDIRYENIHFVERDGSTPINELSRTSAPAFPSIDWSNISNRPEPIRVLETLKSDMVNGRFSVADQFVIVAASSSQSIDWPCPVLNHPLAYVIVEDSDNALNGCYVDAKKYANKVVIVNTSKKEVKVHIRGTAEGVVA